MDLFKHRSEVTRRSARDSPGGPRIRLSTGRGVVRRLRWTSFAGAVLAIVLAMPPMSAVASGVVFPLGDTVITYEALDGESNVLSISRGAVNFDFREDPGVEIFANPQCEPLRLLTTRPPPADPSFAWCPAVGVGLVTVFLRDLNDRLTVTDSANPGEFFPLRAL